MPRRSTVRNAVSLPRNWPLVLILLVAFALRMAWAHSPGYVIDLVFFTRWLRLAARDGLAGALSAPSSYPPLTMYVLTLLGHFARTGDLPTIAPALGVEWYALRFISVTFDVLTIATLYALGRRVAKPGAACGVALLYALCPGGIYLTGWWNQIDAWFVLPMLLATWWLARRRVPLGWAALAVAFGFKSQALLLLPLFVVGTWRWHTGAARARALLSGGLAFGLVLVAIFTPIALGGQISTLVARMSQPTRELNWISLSSHNLWYALTPRARDVLYAEHRDEGAFLIGGVSFRDAGLALLAVGYAAILSRLYLRSRPDDLFLAAGLAWLTLFILATRMHIRYIFPALALLLVAGYRQRRAWGFYGLFAVTLLINLVLKSMDTSPLAWALPTHVGFGVAVAWLNVVGSVGVAILYARPRRRASPGYTARRWEKVVLAGAWIALAGLLGALLWQGHAAGTRLAGHWADLRASLDVALPDPPAEATVVINWPSALVQETALIGFIPVTPPARFYAAPQDIARDGVTWVQFLPWADVPELQVEYHGDYVTQPQLEAHVRAANTVIALSPERRQMVTLARVAPPHTGECVARFTPGGCLVAASAGMDPATQSLTLRLHWQRDTSTSPDLTVFVHVVDAHGALVAQADGDPVRGLLPLSDVPQTASLHETRVIAPLPPQDYRIRLGLYHRATGARMSVVCSPACPDDVLEIVPSQGDSF